MTKLLRLSWFADFVYTVCIILAAVGLLAIPRETSSAARDGIKLCLDVIVPSLFPFFVLSALVVDLGLADRLGKALEKVMRPLFAVSGACSAAVVLGFFGGYPVGAKTAISLYEKGLCSKEEAERLLAFCNNSGPAFILGAVGTLLGSSQAGWILFFTHAAASVIVGVIFRFYKRKKTQSAQNIRIQPEVNSTRKPQFTQVFTGAVKNSFMSVFYISAFVIFFTVAIRILFVSGVLPNFASFIGETLSPFGVSQKSVESVLIGFIELTSGLWNIQGGAAALLSGKMAMVAFMLGWAGLSVHCQVLGFIGESGLTPWTYISGKFLHGIISAVLTFITVNALGFNQPVASMIAERVEVLAQVSFLSTLTTTLKVAAVILFVFLVMRSRKADSFSTPR